MIKSVITLASIGFAIAADKIGFVYENIRHGARAPIVDPVVGFKVT